MRNDHRRELTPRELHRQRRKEQIQRRRLVAALCLLGLIIIIVVLVATCDSGNDTPTTITKSGGTTTTTLATATYVADLTGDSSVPPVDTTATGTLTLKYDADSEEFSFVINVEGLSKPTGAAIYVGADGDAGTAVYTLYADTTQESKFSGILAQGTIEEANLTGSLAGKKLGDLVALIKAGNAYASVGTADNPVDGIRGQISLSVDDTSSTGTSDDTSSSSTTDTTG
jgi:hypothetical protein